MIPILIQRSNSTLDLYNGDVGLLARRDPYTSSPDDFALFRRGGEELRLPAPLLPPFEPAYCLSIHKSQGSEYREVMVALPDGVPLLSRELLYTAITRAKRNLTLIASDETLAAALSQTSMRLSGLIDRLKCRGALI